jgi:hypothetical protein
MRMPGGNRQFRLSKAIARDSIAIGLAAPLWFRCRNAAVLDRPQ